MYINERDQINYHGFLRALRAMHQVSQEAVSKGICTISGMNRFENGNRMAEKLMGDRLTARLGISGEKYEDYLQPPQYAKWEHRMRIIRAIEKRDLEVARRELDSYADIPNHNCLNKQFVETMRFMILSLENAPEEELLSCIQKAVKCTVPNVNKALAGAHLLADQEINLILEQMRLTQPKKVVRDVRSWRIAEYEKLITYMENSNWESLQKAKIYPRVVFYICQLLLAGEPDEETCRYGLNLCDIAIELLRDNGRLYYFIELTETRRVFAERLMSYEIEPSERKMLEEMLSENNSWEAVFKALYEEYKVAPYMSDFCYLYYETECHDMVQVVETRRKMLGLSRVRLADGICTDRTIIRFEREGRNPTVDLIRLLFEKMGMCAEYRRAKVITNDVEALLLAKEVAINGNRRDFALWERNLRKLESKLCMNILHNKQEISRACALLKYRSGRIDADVFGELTKESLEYSLPIAALDMKGNKHLTRNELSNIFDLAIYAKGEVSEKCYNIIYEKYGIMNREILPAEMPFYGFVTGGLVSLLGDKGRYEESTRISHHVVKECLSNRRIGQIMSILYNIVWNYENNEANLKPNHTYIKELLYKGLIISVVAKNSNRSAFFRDKLAGYE